MSDEEESSVNSQEEQEDDEQNSEEQQDDDQQENDSQQDNQDQQEGSGDDDDSDQEEDEEGGSGDDDEEEQQNSSFQEEEDEGDKQLPSFKMVNKEPPQQFKFTSLLNEISSLSSSVDNFIGTLHTSPSTGFRRPYTNNYAAQQTSYQPQISEIRMPQPPAQSRVVMMKDEDTQVDMKPQIIIQPTKSIKQDSIIQAKPYKISNQSQKFLAQLYQENKKLKRWQVNPNQSMASYMGSYTGSNGFAGSGKGFYGSKDKFERKEYEKGLFNVEQRNKEIDEAIMMLKREEQSEY